MIIWARSRHVSVRSYLYVRSKTCTTFEAQFIKKLSNTKAGSKKCNAYKKRVKFDFTSVWLEISEFPGTFKFLWAFYKINKFVSGSFETCLWRLHLRFFEDKQGIFACALSNFHPGLEKMSIIWKVWYFHPWLKVNLGLSKPSWNFYM